MSRSRKKISIHNHCNAGSMKEWKRSVNKRYRAKVRDLLSHVEDWEQFSLPKIDEAGTIWDSPKDGPRMRDWNPPDNDECIRDWSRLGGERWVAKWVNTSPDGLTFIYEWKLQSLPKLENNHYPFTGQKERYYERCECLRNKNSWYWKKFRK